MAVLITGVAGFIGRSLVSQLENTEYKLIGLDIAETLDKEVSEKLEEYRPCDLFDGEQAKKCVDDIDVIIHLAGEASVNREESVYTRNNIKAFSNLLGAVAGNRVRKIILLSTEKTAKQNGNYAKSKALSEEALREFSSQYGVNFTILRCGAVYGSGMKSNIVEWLLRIKNQNIFAIPESKSEIAMIGKKDLCRIINECISNPKTNNRTYTVTDGNPYPINSIERKAREVLKCDVEPFCYPKWSLFLGAIFGDIVTRFGGHFPLNSNAYHMFFQNTVKHDNSIYSDTGITPEQNFLEEIPVIFTD